jgi:hypothetical protein
MDGIDLPPEENKLLGGTRWRIFNIGSGRWWKEPIKVLPFTPAFNPLISYAFFIFSNDKTLVGAWA